MVKLLRYRWMNIFNIKNEESLINKNFSLNTLAVDQSFDSEIGSETEGKSKYKKQDKKFAFLGNAENKAKIQKIPNDCVTLNIKEMKNK